MNPDEGLLSRAPCSHRRPASCPNGCPCCGPSPICDTEPSSTSPGSWDSDRLCIHLPVLASARSRYSTLFGVASVINHTRDLRLLLQLQVHPPNRTHEGECFISL
ncbi:hypothetical protein TNIN_118771 [Trichonephila inaurata madagascariensis]|uniref:Uncharacterized protein n=1 Tax=Trichonephila inaurata madagascariensis TaxID=2747483 RepID=A0A8X6XJQ3_9ARAC|nr:hypothetical protein TNIN_118771 [Trichonephila inaurata madagascariensis]